jgi:predicted transcriptional regulator
MNKSQREISELLGISEQTISKWQKEDNWKAVRDAKLNTSKNRAEAIKEVISQLTQRRLQIFKDLDEAIEREDDEAIMALKKESAALSQEVAMQAKALDKMEVDAKISIRVYLEVMEDLFESLRSYDPDLFMKTLSFQDSQLLKIANKLG